VQRKNDEGCAEARAGGVGCVVGITFEAKGKARVSRGGSKKKREAEGSV